MSPMAEAAGFEPTRTRVKVWCLAAWRRLNIYIIIIIYTLIIINYFMSRITCYEVFAYGFITNTHPGIPPSHQIVAVEGQLATVSLSYSAEQLCL